MNTRRNHFRLSNNMESKVLWLEQEMKLYETLIDIMLDIQDIDFMKFHKDEYKKLIGEYLRLGHVIRIPKP